MSYKNQLAKFRISDGWAQHIARGSAGGIDYVAPKGTPIPAPCDGTLSNQAGNGSGGNIATFTHNQNRAWQDQFLHLSRFAKPGNYKQGEIIGWSGGVPGDPGAGSSTGAHIHWHLLISGTRVNPLLYIDGAPTPSLNTWQGVQTLLAKSYGYTGPIDGIPGPNTWRAIQTWLKAKYGYTGPIDGVPGPNTYAALKRAGVRLK
jgi:murein DD-endopeptidase